jgi:hypothetical protein
VAQWVEAVLDEGRVAGQWDPQRRLKSWTTKAFPARSSSTSGFRSSCITAGRRDPRHSRTPEQVEAANRAYNRWLADFCNTAPERLFGLAVTTFDDIDATIAEFGGPARPA